jgi:hypothetical protein
MLRTWESLPVVFCCLLLVKMQVALTLAMRFVQGQAELQTKCSHRRFISVRKAQF